MLEILLTNDDGYESPLLAPIINRLKPHGNLTVVCPLHEQSWRSKSVTRCGELQASEIEIAGVRGFTVNGTPADCVNLAIHHLCRQVPELLVSGINNGENAGLGFILSSGTLGACLEANIAGMPAVAVSQLVDRDTFFCIRDRHCLPEAAAERLHSQMDDLVGRLFARLLSRPELLSRPLTWNINLPFNAAQAPELRPARIGIDVYGSIFAHENGVYRHALRSVTRETTPDTEFSIIDSGHASVVVLDPQALCGAVSPLALEFAVKG